MPPVPAAVLESSHVTTCSQNFWPRCEPTQRRDSVVFPLLCSHQASPCVRTTSSLLCASIARIALGPLSLRPTSLLALPLLLLLVLLLLLLLL